MSRNTLEDLNNHLFAQLERLNDEDLKDPEDIRKEVERSKAVNGLAKNIIDNAKVTLEVIKVAYETVPGSEALPKVFGITQRSKS